MPEEVKLTGSMQDAELMAALDRLDSRLTGVEVKLGEVREAGKAAGDGLDDGMGKASRATDKARRSAERAVPPIKKAGDEALKSGTKARASASGWDKFAKSMDKAAKKGSGFGGIFSTFKWAGIALGIQLIAGAISAAGAASVIGVAHLAPLLLNLLNLAPAGLAAAASMWALKLATKQLKPEFDQIKNEFTGLGPMIAGGGLRSGIQSLANNLMPLSTVVGHGLSQLGGVIGAAARQLGVFARQGSTLSSVRAIFAGLLPIERAVLQALLSLLPGVLAALRAIEPVTAIMANAMAGLTRQFSAWLVRVSRSGQLTRWLISAWHGLQDAGEAIANVIIGIFNVMRIANGVTHGFGQGVDNLTARFRNWTESASGQRKITQYFVDALPAIHEFGRLLGLLARGFAHLASGSHIAPLLAQINNQLIPALSQLFNRMSSLGGVGPTLITVASDMAILLSHMDFNALGLFAEALLKIVSGLVWLQQHVPGANFVLSTLFTTLIGFKLLSPVFSMLSKGGKAFGWLSGALKGTKEFSGAFRFLGPIFQGVGGLFSEFISTAITGLGELSAALFTTPVGWIILAIIAVIAVVILLWNKCAWFRDAVKAVWRAISVAAVAAWDWIKNAFTNTVNWIVNAARNIGNFFSSVWHGVTSAVTTVTNFFTSAWRTAVSVVTVIWNGMLIAFRPIWFAIKFVVQTVVYIIIGIITVLAIAAKSVWIGIVATANVAWNVIKSVVGLVVGWIITSWHILAGAVSTVWNVIATGAQWVFNTIIMPLVRFVVGGFIAEWQLISIAARAVWNALVAGAQWLWALLSPIFTGIGHAGAAIWGGIVSAFNFVKNGIVSGWNSVWGALSPLFNRIGHAGAAIWDGIKNAASSVAGVVRGIWNGVMGIVKGAYNTVARGWNSIPDITVPSWVPGLGGKSFGLPKLPLLYAGGPTPGGPAVVGEHGPELHVRGGRIVGVLGARGPEIVPNLPRGGYVVPNAATIARGMARPIPSSVAAAVATTGARPTPVGDRRLTSAVDDLAAAVRDMRPPIAVSGDASAEEVLAALRADRRERTRNRYSYTGGRG